MSARSSPRLLRQPWDERHVKSSCLPPTVRLESSELDPKGVAEAQRNLLAHQKAVDALLVETDALQTKLLPGSSKAKWLTHYYTTTPSSSEDAPEGATTTTTTTAGISPRRVAPTTLSSPRGGGGRLLDASFRGTLSPQASSPGSSRKLNSSVSKKKSPTDKGDSKRIPVPPAPPAAPTSGGTPGASPLRNKDTSTFFLTQVETSSSRRTTPPAQTQATTVASCSEASPSAVCVTNDVKPSIPLLSAQERKSMMVEFLDEVTYRCETFMRENVEEDVFIFDPFEIDQTGLVALFSGDVDDAVSNTANPSAATRAADRIRTLLRDDVHLMTFQEMLAQIEQESNSTATITSSSKGSGSPPARTRRRSTMFNSGNTGDAAAAAAAAAPTSEGSTLQTAGRWCIERKSTSSGESFSRTLKLLRKAFLSAGVTEDVDDDGEASAEK